MVRLVLFFTNTAYNETNLLLHRFITFTGLIAGYEVVDMVKYRYKH